jgi:hypothetical protein
MKRSLPLVALLAGAAVAVLLGVYGKTHDPTYEPGWTFGFGSMIQMKVWLALAVGVLAVGQSIGAAWMYSRIPSPAWLPLGHRLNGALTILVSLPVAFHCLWSLGFQSYDGRVLAHSLAGCAVYGAFVTKVYGVHSRKLPGWFLPAAGGLLFTLFVTVVLTSAGWYLQTNGLPTSTGY